MFMNIIEAQIKTTNRAYRAGSVANSVPALAEDRGSSLSPTQRCATHLFLQGIHCCLFQPLRYYICIGTQTDKQTHIQQCSTYNPSKKKPLCREGSLHVAGKVQHIKVSYSHGPWGSRMSHSISQRSHVSCRTWPGGRPWLACAFSHCWCIFENFHNKMLENYLLI